MRGQLQTLEFGFLRVGMPVWSFGETVNWRWRDNIIIDKDGKLAIPDYEAGLPSPHPLYFAHFDDVDLRKLKAHLKNNQSVVQSVVGKKRAAEMYQAVKEYEVHVRRWRRTESPLMLRKFRSILAFIRGTRIWKKWHEDRLKRMCNLCRVFGVAAYDEQGVALIDPTLKINGQFRRVRLYGADARDFVEVMEMGFKMQERQWKRMMADTARKRAQS